MTTPGGDLDATARVETDVRPSSSRSRAGESQFAPGTIIAGRYRIASLLGSGGMGEVYRADDTKLDQPVALKFLPARLARDPILLGRLHDEVRLGRQIAHPNVCRIYDIVDWEGSHFVAMEYVDGEDLSKLLRRIGRLSADKAVDIARGIASGLMAAHSKGILHRDLKPANVMVDSRGDAKIMDFGLALSDDDDDGTISGTPAYMAPEQFDGTPATTRSDLYALGLVMYELFTGKRTHNARTMPERIRERTSEITTPSSLIRDLDPAVERIILRCLANDPNQRPSSAREVIHSLPGGDPLAAAMAAGETPSPRIVAAAGSEGSLRPAVAWSMLGAIVLLLALLLARASENKPLQSWGVATPLDVQSARAKDLLRDFGLPEQPFVITGLEEKLNYHAWVYVNDRAPTKWLRLGKGLPRVTFWLRQAPGPLVDDRPNTPNPRADRTGPRQSLPGSSTIEIDSRGRLFSLEAIPVADWKARPLDWNELLAAAGLQSTAMKNVEPKTIPPMFSDARAAWSGMHPIDGTPIRVEAAAFHGRPVFFRIIAPWDEKNVRGAVPFGGSGFDTFMMFVGLAVITFGAALAWRNLRLRRGDRQAAWRITVALFLLNSTANALVASHELTITYELTVLRMIFSQALLNAAIFGVLYIALEPYVRRRWPDRLISWARLVAGKWRDPLIGRHVMIGTIAGLMHATLAAYMPKLATFFTHQPAQPTTGDLSLLAIPGAGIASFLYAAANGIVTGLTMMTGLVVLTIALRRRWLAATGLYVVLFTAFLFASHEIWALMSFAVVAGIYTTVVARFGMLAAVAMHTAFVATFFAAMPDSIAWYTVRALTPTLLLLTLAICAFVTSLGGQRAFAANLLDD